MPQSVTDLYRTGVAATDPTFLPSCTDRADYLKQTGKQAPNHDPSQPNKFWWDPSAASLPPTQSVSYQVWNQSLTTPALISVTMTAAAAAVPNVPGDITYPAYILPDATGVTWATNTQFSAEPLPAQNLCTLADAQKLAAMIPGSKIISGKAAFPSGEFLLNGVVYPVSAAAQPWWIILPSGVGGFAGIAVAAMYAKGVGAPCHWQLNASGFYDLIFNLPTDSPSTSTAAIPCNAVPAGFQLVSVVTGLIPTVEILPIGSGGPMTLTVSGTLSAGTYSVTSVPTPAASK